MTVTEVIMRESAGKDMSTPWKISTEAIITAHGIVAKGSRYKAFESKNFGYVVFDAEARTIQGTPLHKRIYRY